MNETIRLGMDFTRHTCRTCGIVYLVPTSFDAGKRQSKEYWFCPNGHQWAYVESESDKLRRERDRLKQDAARLVDEAQEAHERVEQERRRSAAARGQVTKLKKRAANGVCPCCNRTFADLQRHMSTKHPTFISKPDDASHVH